MDSPRMQCAPARRFAALSVAMALVSGLPGCGEAPLPDVGAPTYPASGKVLTSKGNPLPGGVVVFVPEGSGSLTATGPIAPDGTFTLNTGGVAPGAPAGDYRVRIELDPEADMSAFGNKRGLPFPAKYAKESSSGLTATVKPEGGNEFTFTLK